MKRVLQILSIFIYCNVYSQYNAKTYTGDFNKDGVADTLTSYYDGGSGFGWKYAKITNGKTGEVFSMETGGCFCRIKTLVYVEPELLKPGNSVFMEMLKTEILPVFSEYPDASLEWILAGTASHKHIEDNKYYDLIIDPGPQWKDDEFRLPQSYYVSVYGDGLKAVFQSDEETPEWFNKETDTAFLVYLAGNHYRISGGDSIKPVDRSDVYSVFRTAHAVLVYKNNLYKWLFVSDYDLTGAPEKLRWESVKSIVLKDDYLVVVQSLAPDIISRIFMINIETGICGRLKFPVYDFKNEDVGGAAFINGDSIFLRIDGEQESYKFTDITNELELQYLSETKK